MSINPSGENSKPSHADPGQSSMKSDTTEDRKKVFHALVQLQDLGESVATSRAQVSAQFQITPEKLADIEREGIAMSWPPL